MSRTYHIICKDCKEELWIGQKSNGNIGEGTIYFGDEEVTSALQTFLYKHEDHSLIFTQNYLEDLGLESF